MLTIWGERQRTNCEGTTRRNFLRVGTLGLTSLSLGGLLRSRASAVSSGTLSRDTSVVWVWLGGGATHIETFDPKMDAPAEFRSAVGEVKTSLPGVTIGGLFPKIAAQAHRMAIVRSFAHGNSGHAGGTHFVMTGVDHPPADAGLPPIKPSFGSITARVRGTNHAVTGIPTYVRLSGLYADGPQFLGPANAPFDVGGEARNNMNIAVGLDRLGDRRSLLKLLDHVDREVDRTGEMRGLDAFERQAFSVILGRSKEAFDITREDPRLRSLYGPGLGEQLLMARRLCEAGCGFVTLNYANSAQAWDMHGAPNQPNLSIDKQLQQACPPMDHAISVFLEDLAQRRISQRILLVVTGEFGRTPRINQFGGRDHWGPLCTLALAGGGLAMGQVIGESSAKAELPKSAPIDPKDLMATIFHVLGIDPAIQYPDAFGRPQYLLPDGARPIAELV
jgi:hypothetical protein